MPKRLLLVGIVTAVVVSISGRLGTGAAAYRGDFPDFELEIVSHAETLTTAASFEKLPALVNVWASWCIACRDEHLLLIELAKSGRIALYGVNYLDVRADATRWLDYFGDPYEFSVYDQEGRLGDSLGIEVIPATYLLGPDGRIRYGHVGPLDDKLLQKEIWPRVVEMGQKNNETLR